MKKYMYLIALLCISVAAKAAPGDTTWVQANKARLEWYGSYDSAVVFPSLTPGKTYRTIYMIFTLGKYTCPDGSQWCGDWDYTVQNYLLTPDGRSFELGRLITPYANAAAPRTPFTWTQNYVFDVTDYASILHDNAIMRIFYSGYSGGFTADIKFVFIEGTPDREVVGVRKLWAGSYAYGDQSHGGRNDINVHFPTIKDTVPANARAAEVKFTVTGHGSDNNGCSEFCSHNYYVYSNFVKVDSYTIWRADCGKNQLYPQSGTWIFDRGNWCPGALVHSGHHSLPGIAPGAVTNIGLQFDYYAGSGGASYTTEGTLFYYGGMKKVLDASIEQIVAPTRDENHFRENPTCGTPVIHVKNRGAAKIDSILVEYWVDSATKGTYTWVGTLRTFDETDITLPTLPDLIKTTGDTTRHLFTARILSVNGAPDADRTNNIMRSQFKKAPLWPSSFKISFRTNNQRIAPTSNQCETTWGIYDMDGNLVKGRLEANINTLNVDTLNLPTGCYKLVITDGSCDGLHFWLWDANPSVGINAGVFTINKLTSGTPSIPLNGYTYSGNYGNDFGCGFTQYFYTTTPTGITSLSESPLEILAYPNPAQNTVTIALSGMDRVNGVIQLIDALGRVVTQDNCNTAQQQLNTSSLANGIYTVLFVDNVSGNKLTTRLLIAK